MPDINGKFIELLKSSQITVRNHAQKKSHLLLLIPPNSISNPCYHIAPPNFDHPHLSPSWFLLVHLLPIGVNRVS